MSNDDRMDVLPEKKRYEPGDQAVFQVRMPFRKATALVTVEREGVMDAFVTDLSGALAGLSQINIPLPKLEAFNFSGANLTAEEAKKLLPEGSIGELFLQLPMPVVEEAKYKVEESSKWTAGRVAASGTTAGPQTPR